MRLALTGTPGTGKTTVADLLAGSTPLDVRVVHLNEVVRAHDLWTEHDDERDSLVADVDALRAWLEERYGQVGRDDTDRSADDRGGDDRDGVAASTHLVVESHLAHYLDADRVVVLRCHPAELESRLVERGEPADTATENAESEALDVVLSEAVGRHGPERVYEIDTTDRTPREVAAEVTAVLRDERDPSAGTVDFVDYL